MDIQFFLGEDVKRRLQCDTRSEGRSSGVDLETLLRRGDIWRGHSQVFANKHGVDTGFEPLNRVLIQSGWPQACLVECIQTSSFSASWLLMAHAAKLLTQDGSGLIVMLNPPGIPYAPALLKMGVSTRQLIVVSTASKADFIACFVELSRAKACALLLAWSPAQNLAYNELRKCQLAAADQEGLYCLFRDSAALNASSPAALRVQFRLQIDSLSIQVLKQRGCLVGQSVKVPIPHHWLPEPAYVDLDSAHTDITKTSMAISNWAREQAYLKTHFGVEKAVKKRHSNTSSLIHLTHQLNHFS